MIDIIIHLDKYLSLLISTYGTFVYIILFLVIFLETGIVVAPFLPGDSLLFLAGTFAGFGSLNVLPLYLILTIAAILGDSVNYLIGDILGAKIIEKNLVKEEYIEKTKNFYEKYGNKTRVLSRFVPIVRTLAPFIAGIGKMHYGRFLFYNVVGGIAWTTIFIFSGYFFGGIKTIKDNLAIVTLIIVFLSILPGIIEIVKEKFSKEKPLQ